MDFGFSHVFLLSFDIEAMSVGQIDWLLRETINGCLFVLKDNETKIRDTLLTIVWEVLGLGNALGVDADIDHL